MSATPDPPTEHPGSGHEAPADDAVIGRAFRRSITVFALVGIAVGVAWALRSGDPAPALVDETEAVLPVARDEAAADALPVLPFSDVTDKAGISFRHENGARGAKLLPETMGGGVLAFDADGDGLPDLLFTNGTTWEGDPRPDPAPSAALYLNRGDGTFEDATTRAGLTAPGYGMGGATGDVDGDGDLDLFLTYVGPDRLYRNRGDGTFEDATASAGLAGPADAWSTSAGFFDADGDGDLDLLCLRYVVWSRAIDEQSGFTLTGLGRAYGPPKSFAGTHSALYRNRGDGTFEDVSAESGIEVRNDATGAPAGKGLGLAFCDLEPDGDLNVLVANDTTRNFLFRNRGDGRFEEIGVEAGVAFDRHGQATGAMGVDMAELPAADPGAFELGFVVANFANEMSSLYVRFPDLGEEALFTDEAIGRGIGPASRKALSFGVLFCDVDLDGRPDLVQANGHLETEIERVQPSQRYRQPAQLFWNAGPDAPRTFTPLDAGRLSDLATPLAGRGLAALDFDRDGDEDLVIAQSGDRPRLLRNDQARGHRWLRVRLHQPGPNPFAVGARVEVTAGGRTARRLYAPTRSYLSQCELPLTFGLGAAARVERVRVTWPGGGETVLEDVAVDQELRVTR